MKKRIFCAALLAAMVCAAASCGDSKPASTTPATSAQTEAEQSSAVSAGEVAKAVLDEVPISSAFEKKPESYEDYFDSLDVDSITDSSYYICASGAYPDEIAVFRFASSDSAKAAVAAVQEHLDTQDKYFRDYTPEEAYKLDDAVIEQSGEWLIYLVTSDNAKAKETALGLIG